MHNCNKSPIIQLKVPHSPLRMTSDFFTDSINTAPILKLVNLIFNQNKSAAEKKKELQIVMPQLYKSKSKTKNLNILERETIDRINTVENENCNNYNFLLLHSTMLDIIASHLTIFNMAFGGEHAVNKSLWLDEMNKYNTLFQHLKIYSIFYDMLSDVELVNILKSGQQLNSTIKIISKIYNDQQIPIFKRLFKILKIDIQAYFKIKNRKIISPTVTFLALYNYGLYDIMLTPEFTQLRATLPEKTFPFPIDNSPNYLTNNLTDYPIDNSPDNSTDNKKIVPLVPGDLHYKMYVNLFRTQAKLWKNDINDFNGSSNYLKLTTLNNQSQKASKLAAVYKTWYDIDDWIKPGIMADKKKNSLLIQLRKIFVNLTASAAKYIIGNILNSNFDQHDALTMKKILDVKSEYNYIYNGSPTLNQKLGKWLSTISDMCTVQPGFIINHSNPAYILFAAAYHYNIRNLLKFGLNDNIRSFKILLLHKYDKIRLIGQHILDDLFAVLPWLKKVSIIRTIHNGLIDPIFKDESELADYLNYTIVIKSFTPAQVVDLCNNYYFYLEKLSTDLSSINLKITKLIQLYNLPLTLVANINDISRNKLEQFILDNKYTLNEADQIGMLIPRTHKKSPDRVKFYMIHNMNKYVYYNEGNNNRLPIDIHKLETIAITNLEKFSDLELLSEFNVFINYNHRHDLIKNLYTLLYTPNFFCPLTRNGLNDKTHIFTQTDDYETFMIAYGYIHKYRLYELEELKLNFKITKLQESTATFDEPESASDDSDETDEIIGELFSQLHNNSHSHGNSNNLIAASSSASDASISSSNNSSVSSSSAHNNSNASSSSSSSASSSSSSSGHNNSNLSSSNYNDHQFDHDNTIDDSGSDCDCDDCSQSSDLPPEILDLMQRVTPQQILSSLARFNTGYLSEIPTHNANFEIQDAFAFDPALPHREFYNKELINLRAILKAYNSDGDFNDDKENMFELKNIIKYGMYYRDELIKFNAKISESFQNLQPEEKDIVKQWLYTLFNAGMRMRRWAGPGTPYPQLESETLTKNITNEDIPEYEEQTIAELKKLFKLESKMSATLKFNLNNLMAQEIRRGVVLSVGKIGPHIQVVTDDGWRGDAACIRLNSTIFIGTAYCYLLSIFNEIIPNFNPFRLDAIQ